jgi:hypothetical protein
LSAARCSSASKPAMFTRLYAECKCPRAVGAAGGVAPGQGLLAPARGQGYPVIGASTKEDR